MLLQIGIHSIHHRWAQCRKIFVTVAKAHETSKAIFLKLSLMLQCNGYNGQSSPPRAKANVSSGIRHNSSAEVKVTWTPARLNHSEERHMLKATTEASGRRKRQGIIVHLFPPLQPPVLAPLTRGTHHTFMMGCHLLVFREQQLPTFIFFVGSAEATLALPPGALLLPNGTRHGF